VIVLPGLRSTLGPARLRCVEVDVALLKTLPNPPPQRLIVQAQPRSPWRLVFILTLRPPGDLWSAAKFAFVNRGDDVAEAVEGVVVVVERRLRAAGVCVGGVAVEFGFAEEVGAGQRGGFRLCQPRPPCRGRFLELILGGRGRGANVVASCEAFSLGGVGMGTS
jgi:hypothetical protein